MYKNNDNYDYKIATYNDINKYLNSLGFEEYTYKDFYRDIFKNNLDDYGKNTKGKYIGMAIEKLNEDPLNRGHIQYVYNDLDKLDTLIEKMNFCMLGPYSYFGKISENQNVAEIYGFVFELDDLFRGNVNSIEVAGIRNIFTCVERSECPRPTYITSSGHGVHLYFIFDKPYKNKYEFRHTLAEYREQCIDLVWGVCSTLKKKQKQHLFQKFRIVGSPTKNMLSGESGYQVVKAFKTGEHLTIDELNSVTSIDHKISIEYHRTKNKMSYAEAKDKYPNWDPRVPKTYTLNRAVFNTYKQLCRENIHVGCRYYRMYYTVVMGKKCGLSDLEIKTEVTDLFKYITKFYAGQTDKPQLLVSDLNTALLAVDEDEVKLKRTTKGSIEVNADIKFNTPRRNWQKQKWHLEDIREKKKRMKLRGQEFKNPDGRPKGSGTKKDQIIQFRKNNPTANKNQCIKATGISKMTVYKWWDAINQEDS